MPSYDAINRFVNGVDPQALAKALNQWLGVHQDKLPKSLALDGKDLGHSLGAVVTLCRHEASRHPPSLKLRRTGLPATAGKRTIANCPWHRNLSSRVVAFWKTRPSPPTPCIPKKTNRIIFALGGENLSVIKENQENYRKYAEQLLNGRPVDLVGELERGHDRFEVWDITIVPVDTEVSPFPHIAQIIKCTRIYRSIKEGSEPEMAVRLFGTSHEEGSKTAAQLLKMIRGHWSVENLNHWKRDATYWREDSQANALVS